MDLSDDLYGDPMLSGATGHYPDSDQDDLAGEVYINVSENEKKNY